MMPKMRMTITMRVSPSEYPPIRLPSFPEPLSLPTCRAVASGSPSLAALPFSCPSGGWPTSGLNHPLLSLTPDFPPHLMDELPGGSTPITPVIKAGWLDKNPPQG